jgi:hypothetical protein
LRDVSRRVVSVPGGMTPVVPGVMAPLAPGAPGVTTLPGLVVAPAVPAPLGPYVPPAVPLPPGRAVLSLEPELLLHAASATSAPAIHQTLMNASTKG